MDYYPKNRGVLLPFGELPPGDSNSPQGHCPWTYLYWPLYYSCATVPVNLSVFTAARTVSKVPIISSDATHFCAESQPPGVPDSVITPLKADMFACFLRHHPDRVLVDIILSILRKGADIG